MAYDVLTHTEIIICFYLTNPPDHIDLLSTSCRMSGVCVCGGWVGGWGVIFMFYLLYFLLLAKDIDVHSHSQDNSLSVI